MTTDLTSFSDEKLSALLSVLKDHHGSVAYATELFGEALVEAHRRGWIRIDRSDDSRYKR